MGNLSLLRADLLELRSRDGLDIFGIRVCHNATDTDMESDSEAPLHQLDITGKAVQHASNSPLPRL